MVPFCITPEQIGSLLYNIGTKGSLLYNIGTKRFRFMASETNIFFLFNVLSKQMVLISVPFWMERFFCIQKDVPFFKYRFVGKTNTLFLCIETKRSFCINSVQLFRIVLLSTHWSTTTNAINSREQVRRNSSMHRQLKTYLGRSYIILSSQQKRTIDIRANSGLFNISIQVWTCRNHIPF